MDKVRHLPLFSLFIVEKMKLYTKGSYWSNACVGNMETENDGLEN